MLRVPAISVCGSLYATPSAWSEAPPRKIDMSATTMAMRVLANKVKVR